VNLRASAIAIALRSVDLSGSIGIVQVRSRSIGKSLESETRCYPGRVFLPEIVRPHPTFQDDRSARSGRDAHARVDRNLEYFEIRLTSRSEFPRKKKEKRERMPFAGDKSDKMQADKCGNVLWFSRFPEQSPSASFPPSALLSPSSRWPGRRLSDPCSHRRKNKTRTGLSARHRDRRT